jgi:hypothetical protein
VHVRLDEGDVVPSPEALPLIASGRDLTYSAAATRLERDLVVRIAPAGITPVQVSAFRNPEGRLPDGLSLAPWERPSEIPAEKDGFFLLQAFPPGEAPRAEGTAAPAASRPAVSLAILFDTFSAIDGPGWRPPTLASFAFWTRCALTIVSSSSRSIANRRRRVSPCARPLARPSSRP